MIHDPTFVHCFEAYVSPYTLFTTLYTLIMAPNSRIILTRHAQAEHNVDLDYTSETV